MAFFFFFTLYFKNITLEAKITVLTIWQLTTEL